MTHDNAIHAALAEQRHMISQWVIQLAFQENSSADTVRALHHVVKMLRNMDDMPVSAVFSSSYARS
jgi:hypothetical protein